MIVRWPILASFFGFLESFGKKAYTAEAVTHRSSYGPKCEIEERVCINHGEEEKQEAWRFPEHEVYEDGSEYELGLQCGAQDL